MSDMMTESIVEVIKSDNLAEFMKIINDEPNTLNEVIDIGEKKYLPFHFAIICNSNSIVDWVIQDESMLNRHLPLTGHTPLITATIYKKVSIVKKLLASGANINITDNEDYTALHWAVIKNDLTVANILLQANPWYKFGEGDSTCLFVRDSGGICSCSEIVIRIRSKDMRNILLAHKKSNHRKSDTTMLFLPIIT